MIPGAVISATRNMYYAEFLYLGNSNVNQISDILIYFLLLNRGITWKATRIYPVV